MTVERGRKGNPISAEVQFKPELKEKLSYFEHLVLNAAGVLNPAARAQAREQLGELMATGEQLYAEGQRHMQTRGKTLTERQKRLSELEIILRNARSANSRSTGAALGTLEHFIRSLESTIHALTEASTHEQGVTNTLQEITRLSANIDKKTTNPDLAFAHDELLEMETQLLEDARKELIEALTTDLLTGNRPELSAQAQFIYSDLEEQNSLDYLRSSIAGELENVQDENDLNNNDIPGFVAEQMGEKQTLPTLSSSYLDRVQAQTREITEHINRDPSNKYNPVYNEALTEAQAYLQAYESELEAGAEHLRQRILQAEQRIPVLKQNLKELTAPKAQAVLSADEKSFVSTAQRDLKSALEQIPPQPKKLKTKRLNAPGSEGEQETAPQPIPREVAEQIDAIDDERIAKLVQDIPSRISTKEARDQQFVIQSERLARRVDSAIQRAEERITDVILLLNDGQDLPKVIADARNKIATVRTESGAGDTDALVQLETTVMNDLDQVFTRLRSAQRPDTGGKINPEDEREFDERAGELKRLIKEINKLDQSLKDNQGIPAKLRIALESPRGTINKLKDQLSQDPDASFNQLDALTADARVLHTNLNTDGTDSSPLRVDAIPARRQPTASIDLDVHRIIEINKGKPKEEEKGELFIDYETVDRAWEQCEVLYVAIETLSHVMNVKSPDGSDEYESNVETIKRFYTLPPERRKKKINSHIATMIVDAQNELQETFAQSISRWRHDYENPISDGIATGKISHTDGEFEDFDEFNLSLESLEKSLFVAEPDQDTLNKSHEDLILLQEKANAVIPLVDRFLEHEQLLDNLDEEEDTDQHDTLLTDRSRQIEKNRQLSPEKIYVRNLAGVMVELRPFLETLNSYRHDRIGQLLSEAQAVPNDVSDNSTENLTQRIVELLHIELETAQKRLVQTRITLTDSYHYDESDLTDIDRAIDLLSVLDKNVTSNGYLNNDTWEELENYAIELSSMRTELQSKMDEFET